MRIVISWLGVLRRIGQKVGPYLMLEMLLPGGTLWALLIFLYRRREPDIDGGTKRAVVGAMRTLAGGFAQRILILAPIRLTVPVSKSGPFERL